MKKTSLLTFLIGFAIASDATAVIQFGTDDPATVTNAPTGNLANSGWQYQGTWGGFLGTPVSSNYFLAAKHIGDAGNGDFIFAGNTYEVIQRIDHPSSGVDLTLWKIDGTFPDFSPLLQRQAAHVGISVVHGRGGPRGDGITNEALCGSTTTYLHRGWKHTASDGIMRWGSGRVFQHTFGSGPVSCIPDFNSRVSHYFQGGEETYFALSNGDSSGGLFSYDMGKWRLSGIASGISGAGPYKLQPSDTFDFTAAVTNKGGLAEWDPVSEAWRTCPAVAGEVTSRAYLSDVQYHLNWIYSEIGGVFANKSILLGGSCGFAFEVGGAINGSIIVERSSDLITWDPILTNTASGYRYVFNDGGAVSAEMDFYRVNGPNSTESYNAVGFKRVVVDNASGTNSLTRLIVNPVWNYTGDRLIGITGNSPPDNTLIFKWDETAQQFETDTAQYIEGYGWYPSHMTWSTGEGVYVTVPEGEVLTFAFVGEVPTEISTVIVEGLNLLGYPTCRAVKISEMGFSPVEGDTVLRLVSGQGDSGSWQWESATYQSGAWSNDLTIDIGEGFWYDSARTNSVEWSVQQDIW